jgi:hypothetical protein
VFFYIEKILNVNQKTYARIELNKVQTIVQVNEKTKSLPIITNASGKIERQV